MSGVEVLGTLAAGSQLLGYIFKIGEALFELRDHIKHSPARIRSYVEQLESLACTVQYIQGNQKLHTHVVETLLRAISQKVDALNKILRTSFSGVTHRSSKRYFRIYGEKKTERRIKESLAALEGDKINLVLCITVALDEFGGDRPNNMENSGRSETLLYTAPTKENK